MPSRDQLAAAPGAPLDGAVAAGWRSGWRLVGSLALLSLLIAARCPQLLVAPRLWAEEGSVFLRDALAHGFWANLLRPQLGYLNFATNVSTSCASLLPLEWVPTFTTWVAFGVQLYVAAMALRIRSRGTAGWRAAMVVGALVLLTSPGEIWLTSTNLHYWFGVAAWLVLVDGRGDGERALWSHRLTLLVGGLSGVQSCFLTPLFCHRAWRTQHRERWVQTGILSIATLVELGVLAMSWLHPTSHLHDRFSASGFEWQRVALNHFVLPFVGYEIGRVPIVADFDQAFAGVAASLGIITCSLLVTSVVTVLPLLILAGVQLRRGFGLQAWSGWLLVGALSNLGSLQFAGGFRYAYAPNFFLLHHLVATGQRECPRWQRIVALVLVAAALLSNACGYAGRVRVESTRWVDEVALWRSDPDHQPRIWPADWVVPLPR